jgi:hypothetical protein
VSLFERFALARSPVDPRKTVCPGARAVAVIMVALVVTTVALELTVFRVGVGFVFAAASSRTRKVLDPARVSAAFRMPRVPPFRLTLAGTTTTCDPFDIRRIDDVLLAFV